MEKYIPLIIGKIINAISYISSSFAAKLAIDLFSIPQKGKLKSTKNTFLNSAKQETVLFKKMAIKTYFWKGNKNTILLVHGWESNALRWKTLVKLLKDKNYNIVALDAPAHGASEGKYFNALLYAECLHTVAIKFNVQTIIGHSVGAMSAVFFQHKYKLKQIKKLILLGSPADFKGILKRYETQMRYNKNVSQALKAFILKRYNHLPDYFSPANFSKNIHPQGLVIHDKKDRIIPYKDGLKFKQNYTNSTFIATKGYGHGLKSEKIYQYIIEFLND